MVTFGSKNVHSAEDTLFQNWKKAHPILVAIIFSNDPLVLRSVVSSEIQEHLLKYLNLSAHCSAERFSYMLLLTP